MDRFDELAVFVAILDTGSLAAAGRQLRRSPPSVSRVLAGLEARLGSRLFERTTRRLAPTEAGRSLAERARRLLSDYAAVVQDTGDADALPHGLLRLTAPAVFGRKHVTPVVTRFLVAWPEIQVEMLLSDRNLDLIEEGLDVAVRIGHLVESGLVTRRVGEVRRVLVASPLYLAERGTPRVPEDLADHVVIFTSGRPGPVAWQFCVAGRDRSRRLTPRLMVNDVEAALVAARANCGIASALSYQVAEDLADGRLARLLPEYELPALPVHLVVPSARHMAPRVRVFLDYAARQLWVTCRGASIALTLGRDVGPTPRSYLAALAALLPTGEGRVIGWVEFSSSVVLMTSYRDKFFLPRCPYEEGPRAWPPKRTWIDSTAKSCGCSARMPLCRWRRSPSRSG